MSEHRVAPDNQGNIVVMGGFQGTFTWEAFSKAAQGVDLWVLVFGPDGQSKGGMVVDSPPSSVFYGFGFAVDPENGVFYLGGGFSGSLYVTRFDGNGVVLGVEEAYFNLLAARRAAAPPSGSRRAPAPGAACPRRA